MPKRLPFFVYGTLRRGQANHRLLVGRTTAQFAAQLPGHALYDRGLPYVVECRDPGAVVVGELVFIDPAHYQSLLARLDRLEGYRGPGDGRNHYERGAAAVHYADGGTDRTVRAWVYRAGRRTQALLSKRDRVRGGDWIAA